MTTAALLPPTSTPDRRPRREIVSAVTPNWFASVMGTAIVAIAAATLPVDVPGLRGAAVAVWSIAVLWFAVLVVASVLHWRWFGATARRHHRDPVMSHFYGAVAMATLTVGTSTLLVGRDVVGSQAAVAVDWVCFGAGTVFGLGTAVGVPYVLLTRRSVALRDAFGGWLMPVVPPMVSASAGALLVPHAPAGQPRLILLLACYAMFGAALLTSGVIIVLVFRRLVVHGPGALPMIPTWWIVLGPLGQSVTAANLLAGSVRGVVPATYVPALRDFAVVYGLPVWGLALLWAGLASMITRRAVRQRMPFSLTWWSFTFPVGTCVTGTTGLALHTGSGLLRWAAVLLYAGLVLAWLAVASRTVAGIASGALLRAQTSTRAGALSRAE